MSKKQLTVLAKQGGVMLGSCSAECSEGTTVLIGRGAECNIVLSQPYVSRKHCELVFHNNRWYIKNTGTNKSYLNGVEIEKYTPIGSSDKITLLNGEKTIDIVLSVSEMRDGRSDSSIGAVLSLLVFDGSKELQSIPIDPAKDKTISFGRAVDNDIVLTSGEVSAYHGAVEIRSGHCYIADLGSKNGISVNDSRYLHGNTQGSELNPGDILRMGEPGSRAASGVMMVLAEIRGKLCSLKLSRQTPAVLGRSANCDIHINHVGASRCHAVISFDNSSNTFFIENFGTNGTLLDNSMVTSRKALPGRCSILITNRSFFFCNGIIYYYSDEGGLGLEANALTRDVGKNGVQKRILNNVNLRIHPGEFVAIVGGSGCGKSTLLNALTGYERATSGSVMIDGKSLYKNFEYFKSLIGFVPQQDIVYDHLRLDDMLDYTAQLRMPKDTSTQERKKRIKEVMEAVELTEYASTYVRKLSGGQRKRASIAVELLADPGLFFLDEPTSGLDPGTERNLMRMLRRLSLQNRKTIIMVTHTTLNINLCDRVIFMGKGGKLCFSGKPEDALGFFGVDNFIDIYDKVSESTDKWYTTFERQSQKNETHSNDTLNISKADKPSYFRQAAILSKRYARLMINDSSRLLLLLIEPVAMVILLYLCKPDGMYENFVQTQNMIFTFVCCAIWIGIFNAIQEICKERTILKREYMANLRLSSYITSKFLIQTVLCLIQSVLLLTSYAILIGLPEEGLLAESALPEIFVSVFLSILSSACMGLSISSVCKNPDKAMALSPFVLVVQLIFAGIIFEFEGNVKKISAITISRWAVSAIGTSSELEELQNVAVVLNKAPTDLYEFSTENMFRCWIVLACFSVLFCLLSTVVLRNISRDSR